MENASESAAGAMQPAEVRARVLAIWRDAMQRESISPGDHFHDLGGDSLAATIIAAGTQDAFGVEISAGEVYAYPTPDAFAEIVEQRLADAGAGPA